MKINLQMFAEPVKGSKILYLLRVLENAATNAAQIPAFQTEGTTTISKDADSTATKDGTIRTPSQAEIEISLTTILAKGDTVIEELKSAMLADKLVEVWEVNTEVEGSGDNEGKYEATYYQGYITSLEKSANAEDFVEVSMDIGINGTGATGYATLTEAQKEAAQYAFADTTKVQPAV
jgi:TP901-1 family phage major tail protein